MGFSRKRVGRNGRVRYTAYYKDVKGRERSAGTFPNVKEADRAWQRAETKLAEGRIGDPARGRMTFARYVEGTWLPNHQMEASTRQRYTYSLNKHILPEFGTMRMVDILPEHVRAWITRLQNDGVSAGTINANKSILSAVFTTALNDQVTFLHPCKGVKTPPVSRKPRTIITPEQFDALYWELPDERTRLLVETAIESGTRWGELSELRVKDLHTRSGIVTVSRAVVEVNPKFHPTGGRFHVKDYPKDREYRRFKLSTPLVRKLAAHTDAYAPGPDDLLFPAADQPVPKRRLRVVPDPDTLGLTDPNEQGRQYKHGSLSGYSMGKCRCEHCKGAYAHYRAERRSQGKDEPRAPRSRETDGHIPADWFRRQVWRPALSRADLGVRVRFHDLRHAHASWLLAGGADLQVVKERLGHSDIATTARYLHTLPEADETALSALASIRNRSRGG
ncbi:integrase [Nocardiopsis metallicus]|uniref:Integrase n=1 Tax=Nocardiopsis metallicus TaxID=179819 RepID=A0A840W7H6_9ACTN|nr:integrase [Nocardiopsis metallicus]